MRAVHGVARLEADDRAPAALRERRARLSGREPVLGELGGPRAARTPVPCRRAAARAGRSAPRRRGARDRRCGRPARPRARGRSRRRPRRPSRRAGVPSGVASAISRPASAAACSLGHRKRDRHAPDGAVGEPHLVDRGLVVASSVMNPPSGLSAPTASSSRSVTRRASRRSSGSECARSAQRLGRGAGDEQLAQRAAVGGDELAGSAGRGGHRCASAGAPAAIRPCVSR